MRRFFSVVTGVVCLLAGIAIAQGQEPSAPDSISLEIKVIDISADRLETLETAVKDQASLNRLIAEGKVRPVSTVQVHTRPGDSVVTHVGQRIPVTTSTGTPAPQFEYQNTGLRINARPSVIKGDQITVKIELELTALDISTGRFTPSFSHTSLAETVKMKSGETVILLGIIQHDSQRPGATRAAQATAEQPHGSFAILLTARLSN